jgi:DNA primase
LAISPETIDEVQRVANVYDIISDYLSLKKTGSVYVALCPFHNERTPSFVVSPTKNIFKCFGCGISGNAIKFLMEYEKISFSEAVIKIAQKYGITVKYIGNDKDKHLKGLYSLTRQITDFYKNQLKESQVAREYIRKRGILPQTIIDFEIGYSPESPERFNKFVQENNISIEDLNKIGLISIHDDKIYDKFSGRIIFPIKDHKGNIVGFGGRAIDENRHPKYLNSPETEVYKKSKVLYGLFENSQIIKEKSQVVIVEGYMDLISLYQIGIKNVVATLGTALTKEHVNLLKKYVKEVIVMFDSDEAGKKAAIRAAEILLSEGITVRYAYYTEAKDPDELSKKGLNVVKEIINNAEDIIFFLTRKLKEINNIEDKQQLMKYKTIYNYILTILANIKDPGLRASYMSYLSQILNKTPSKIELEIDDTKKQPEKEHRFEMEEEIDKLNLKLSYKEKVFIKYIYQNPEVLKDEIFDKISFPEKIEYIIDLIKNNTEYELLISDIIQDTKIQPSYKSFQNILNEFVKKHEKESQRLMREAMLMNKF